MMKRLQVLLIVFTILALSVQSQEITPSELSQEFRKWLEEEVIYIISSTEKNVFLQLDTDRERELFIEAFWKHRDPTPGTPENEFRQENYRRIQYANQFFGRRSPKPGWKTDQGRIYILLGEPQDINRITGETQVYNSEIWFYQGLSKYGLPAGFNLVFYQKSGVGELILYSPLNDGPQALMTSYFGDQTNFQEAYRTLKNLNRELAQVSLSLIPGDPVKYGLPSLSSDMLIQNIYRLPQNQFEDLYAEKFLLYKDIVEVDYTSNYINSDALIQVIKDPSGLFFVYYVIELMRFSVQMFQDQYVTNLKINGSVTDLEGKTIYQYEGSIPFKFNEAQLKNITYGPFNFYDMFPLLPGEYKFTVLLKNESSKEFTSVEGDIVIPEDESSVWMTSVILGYKRELSTSQNLEPFRFGKDRVFFQPRPIFHPLDTLYLNFQILGRDYDLLEDGVLLYEFIKDQELVMTFSKRVKEYESNLNIKEEILLKDFSPGHYRIGVILLDGEQEILSQSQHFEITASAGIIRPWVYVKTSSPISHPVYDFVLGMQHLNKGEIKQARNLLERAHQSRPNSMEYSLNLARLYLLENEFEKVKQILLPFSEQSKPHYDVLLFLGKATHALGDLARAVSLFEKAISHFGKNTILLNSLGDCYNKLDRREDALKAWSTSLELNPDQPTIKEKLENLKDL